MNLDRNSTTSLFTQIEADIKNNIEIGVYKLGDKLPTENELMALYNVSRITIRRAIEDLTKEGIIIKKQGKGTFIKEKKIQRKISHTISFTQSCLQSNLRSGSYVTVREILNTSDLSFEEKNIFNDDKVLYIQRVRMANEVPIICENNYYPYSRFSFLLNEPLNESLFQLLETKYNVKVGDPKNSYIDLTTAGVDQANLLKVTSGEPLFLLSTEIYDTENQLIHLGKQYIVGSRYRFYLDE